MKRSQPLKRVPLRPGRRRGWDSTLAPGTAPKRKKKLRAKNPQTGGSRFPKRRDPGYCRWIRTLPCFLSGYRLDAFHDGALGCGGLTECAHVVSRGAGGPDVANTLPCCARHHRQQHRVGIRTFERMYGVNMEMKALYYGAIQPPKYERDNPSVFPSRAPVVSAPPRED